MTEKEEGKQEKKIFGAELVTGTNLPRTKNKVSIMGFAPSSMEMVKAVWDDPDMEIWGLNQMHVAFPALVPKTSRWVQIHPKHSYDQNFGRDYSHHQWLAEYSKKTNNPVYMIDQFPDVPTSVRWPKEEIMRFFQTDYFTNTISWEIALAIMEGFQDIYVFGVDMAQSDEIDSEYAEQRPSCEFFIGWGRGMGKAFELAGIQGKTCRIHIPDQSDLLKTMWLYPYEDNSPFRTKLENRRGELRRRMNMLAGTEQQAHDERMQLLGAAENMAYIKRCWDSSINEQRPQNAIVRQVLEGVREPIKE